MKSTILALCLVLFSNPTIYDDLDHGRIEGRVIDIHDRPITDAHVTVQDETRSLEYRAATDVAGRYLLAMLPPGSYRIMIEAGGFRSDQQAGIVLKAGETWRRDFRLGPAAIKVAIEVPAAASTPAIDTRRMVIGGAFSRRELDDLPVESRNPFDLILNIPGTTTPAFFTGDLAEGEARDGYRGAPEEAGILALNGGLPFSNNLTIEGLDNNDDRAARERFIPSMHAVEEVQVITNQYAAEYGRASGGRINLRLRGGSNNFHGRSFYYFRDESLNANPFARNADPARAKRLPYQNRNAGLSLGGPMRRERIFIFGAYEYDYIYDHAEIAALLPVEQNPAFPLPRPNGRNLGSMAYDIKGAPFVVNDGGDVGLYDERIKTPKRAQTWQSKADLRLNERRNISIITTLARNRDLRGFPGGRRTLDTMRSSGRDSRSLSVSDHFMISPHWVSNLRFQISRLSPADAPASASPVVLITIDDPRDVRGDPAANPLSRSGRLTAGSSTLSGTDRREDRGQLQWTINHARGDHELRFGADLQIISSRFVDLSDTTGTFSFASPGDFLTGRPSRYEHRFRTSSGLGNRYLGLFAQNDWRAKSNLTLAFGLRWDHETILNDRNNLGPRVSFAWSPGDRTVMRGGYGIFYNRALLRTLDDFTLTSNTILVDTNNQAAEMLLEGMKFPGVLSTVDPRLDSLGVRESGFLRRLESGFRIPESYQASLGFERQLAQGVRIEISYSFNRGLHLWRESNANAPILPAGYTDFTSWLLSRDFDNRRDPRTGLRPISSTGNADTVRFDLGVLPSRTVKENGATVVIFGLNNPSTSNASGTMRAAHAAIRDMRPDPALTQIEELQARGNSFYHGVSTELQWRIGRVGSLRGAYTLSRLVDDGVINTSSPLVPGDFTRERSLSLLDARHRVNLSGSFLLPALLGGFKLAGTFNYQSSRPFNIGSNGNDRNLDDVNNDRPNFASNSSHITWRRSGEMLDSNLVQAFSLPPIGSTGNLQRNAGRGPAGHSLNLRVSRSFNLKEGVRLEWQLEAFNPLNSTVFNFGAEFVDFTPNSLSNFLVPQRTVKPRTLRVGLRIDF